MPVLPFIDLLILDRLDQRSCVGAVTQGHRPSPPRVYRFALPRRPLTSMDFVIISAVCFGFALTLAAQHLGEASTSPG